jgi:hypothetical protein
MIKFDNDIRRQSVIVKESDLTLLLIFSIFFVVLGTEVRALHMPGTLSLSYTLSPQA